MKSEPKPRRSWDATLAAAHAGDRDALERLLRATRADARRYATRHCDANDVDDAVQEALLIVARRLSTLRVLAAFPGWLIRVVRRECCRLAGRRPDHEVYDDDAPPPEAATLADETLRESLAQAIEALPAHYREVLLLREVEGLAMTEIARRVGLSASNVKSRLHRARAMTREHLVRSHPELAGKG